MTAVTAEATAVNAGLPVPTPGRLGPYPTLITPTGAGELVTVCGGVGPAAAAAVTATALVLDPPYDVVLSLGIGGGYPGRAAVGDVVVAESLIAADLGAEAPGGPIDLATMGFGESRYPVPAALMAALVGRLVDRLGGTANGHVVRGPVLTVSTATGTGQRAANLVDRFGGAAEAMEGFGVRTAAAPHGLPVAEMRAVSNLVGERDLASWDVPTALRALAQASAAVFADPLPL